MAKERDDRGLNPRSPLPSEDRPARPEYVRRDRTRFVGVHVDSLTLIDGEDRSVSAIDGFRRLGKSPAFRMVKAAPNDWESRPLIVRSNRWWFQSPRDLLGAFLVRVEKLIADPPGSGEGRGLSEKFVQLRLPLPLPPKAVVAGLLRNRSVDLLKRADAACSLVAGPRCPPPACSRARIGATQRKFGQVRPVEGAGGFLRSPGLAPPAESTPDSLSVTVPLRPIPLRDSGPRRVRHGVDEHAAIVVEPGTRRQPRFQSRPLRVGQLVAAERHQVRRNRDSSPPLRTRFYNQALLGVFSETIARLFNLLALASLGIRATVQTHNLFALTSLMDAAWARHCSLIATPWRSTFRAANLGIFRGRDFANHFRNAPTRNAWTTLAGFHCLVLPKQSPAAHILQGGLLVGRRRRDVGDRERRQFAFWQTDFRRSTVSATLPAAVPYAESTSEDSNAPGESTSTARRQVRRYLKQSGPRPVRGKVRGTSSAARPAGPMAAERGNAFGANACRRDVALRNPTRQSGADRSYSINV
ncbi:hypothetical protein LzC2_30440 [Planctomycetes bacterium LzC2]|uniref:Uncharacterized protein n=1 Tax=Alienimonas chondri TaxID=2681879 RepID=A0ABX1VI31_9PLAN|nr:hypothetical protein [Alienimonas chondri]